MIESHWSKENHSELWNRTPIKYSRMKMSELKDRGINSQLLDYLIENLPYGAHVGGGFLSSLIQKKPERAGDVDIFFSEPSAFETVLKMLRSPSNVLLSGYDAVLNDAQIANKETAVVKFEATGKIPIQLIKIIWHTDAAHVIDLFDFTVCQFVTEGDELIFNPAGLIDLLNNQIVIHRIEVHMDLLYRLTKYLKKGFEAPAFTLDRITQEIIKHNKEPESNASPVRRIRNRSNPYPA